MSNNINALQDQLDGLTEDVKADADLILEQIDIEALLNDPVNYIREIAVEFVSQHEIEIQRGINSGHRFAQKILKEIKRADTGQS